MQTRNVKKQIIIRLLLLCAFVFIQAGAKADSVTQEENKTYIRIWVDGMACPFCAYGLEKKVKKIKEATDFYVGINEGFIMFVVPTDKQPSKEALEKMVKEAGFMARKIEYAEEPFKIKEGG